MTKVRGLVIKLSSERAFQAEGISHAPEEGACPEYQRKRKKDRLAGGDRARG